MGLFSFNKNSNNKNTQSKNEFSITFGRYTDRNKTKKQLQYWDESVKFFNQKEYLKAVEALLYYISDEQQNNVTISVSQNSIEFSMIQGSKTFRGKVENGVVEAEGRIARFTNPPVPVMRKLLNLNYALRYTWCGIKDDYLGIYFSSPLENASSWKLYSSFKELALNIDKQDDILVDEFSDSLFETDTEESIPIPQEIAELKYEYLIRWINETIDQIKQSDVQKHSGLNSYRLLALCMRIDYLLIPQGSLVEILEKNIRMYFNKPAGINDINIPIMNEFEAILNTPKDQILKNFYNVKATFAIAPPTPYQKVADFIFEESKTRDYYIKNNEPQHIPIIYEYIAGYNMFYFGMSQPLIDMHHLYFTILHSEFFQKINPGEILYNASDGNLNSHLIIKKINEIVKKNSTNHPGFTYNTNKLKFNSLADFSISYFSEFDFLNLKN